MNRRASFGLVSITNTAVTLRDLGPWHTHLTITNDAENVVAKLEKYNILEGRQLFYYDAEGQLTELVVRNGKFAGFAPAK